MHARSESMLMGACPTMDEVGCPLPYITTTSGYTWESAMVFPGVTDLACLEMLACREAQSLAQDLHLRRIIISCDSKTVVNDLKNGSCGKNGTTVREFIAYQRLFDARDIIFEGRDTNK